MVVPFKHEPFTDFSLEENQKAQKEALHQVEQMLGKEYPLLIDGEEVYTDDKIVSTNPGNKDEVIGKVSKANKELAEKAIQSANEHFEWWRTVSYTHLRAHETEADLVCRLLLEKNFFNDTATTEIYT